MYIYIAISHIGNYCVYVKNFQCVRYTEWSMFLIKSYLPILLSHICFYTNEIVMNNNEYCLRLLYEVYKLRVTNEKKNA